MLLISALLRPPLSGVGPLLGDIQQGLHLSATQLGLLTSLPVLCFGVGAFAGPWLVRRLGLVGAFTMLLVALTVLLATRVWFGFGYLLLASVLVGLAIAICNVIFPTLIRVEFPSQVSRMTAVYTTLLSIFASLASAVAVPLANALGGWQGSMAVWAVPGVFALAAWAVTARLDHPVSAATAQISAPAPSIWGTSLTWYLATFFGLQSANFYVLLSWLPTILMAQGMAAAQAGATLGYLSVIGIPVGLLLTANLRRFTSLTWLVVAISGFTSVGVLLVSAGGSLVMPGATLAGFGLASSFPLALALIAEKATSQLITTRLSAVAQGVGYLIAAAAVYLARATFDALGTWNVALYGIAVLACLQAFAGILAAKHDPI